MKDRKRARANRKKGKEKRLGVRNHEGFIDLTPYNAVLLIRGEKEKLRWK